MALIILQQILTMALYMICGYMLYKTGKISDEGSRSIANLLLWVIIPSTLINSFLTEYSAEKMRELLISFVQAEHDQICTSYTSRILFDILKKQGAPANRLTIWSDEEMEALGMPRELYHGTWVPVLENKEMLSWVYDQHK